jgi:hypothetical protein
LCISSQTSTAAKANAKAADQIEPKTTSKQNVLNSADLEMKQTH